ncbi:40S ribosomal protein S4-3 [Zea mays]|uniref:40S ribosomal protein S4-3 n=2 Tax=Zea mays TaxID=4577 RepID=K7UUD2_MAIZE|nr:40S ribosomal protein S4-3 [Zea mays]AQK92978.1 40S ribosomal protein S4-3 [Zea mays]AQK92995.1 40S ribosomal protein S4-3 [Zea mays]AQK93009.1 40S ribosomal protein S4-3 [Zea mays]AQK93017.1 40S ribosomal protein S4-3 [Zea mays]
MPLTWAHLPAALRPAAEHTILSTRIPKPSPPALATASIPCSDLHPAASSPVASAAASPFLASALAPLPRAPQSSSPILCSSPFSTPSLSSPLPSAMDTTTCSPSWWPSPSSCSRPLFFHLCAYQLVQPPWCFLPLGSLAPSPWRSPWMLVICSPRCRQMFFPSLQQHLGGCRAARRACAASVTTLFTPVSCVRRNA